MVNLETCRLNRVLVTIYVLQSMIQTYLFYVFPFHPRPFSVTDLCQHWRKMKYLFSPMRQTIGWRNRFFQRRKGLQSCPCHLTLNMWMVEHKIDLKTNKLLLIWVCVSHKPKELSYLSTQSRKFDLGQWMKASDDGRKGFISRLALDKALISMTNTK